jgi:hypothetical protein
MRSESDFEKQKQMVEVYERMIWYEEHSARVLDQIFCLLNKSNKPQ